MAEITPAERAAVQAAKAKTAADKATAQAEANKPPQGRTKTRPGKYL